MKIVLINAFNYRKGGSETVFFNTADMLKEHGHEVVAFTLRWPENLPSPQSAYFPQSKETRTGLLKPVKNIITYFYHFEAARKLEELIRREKPDLAHIHLIWGQMTPSILRVLGKHRIPAILTAHDYRIVCPASVLRNGRGEVCEQCQGRKFHRCISNSCCKGSKALSVMMAAEQYFRNAFFNPAKNISGMIYVSDFAKSIHERYMPALKELPSLKLYNSSDSIAQAPAVKPAPGDRYFLYFGRLSAEKGVPALIKAFENMPDRKLIVVGTGPEEEKLKRSVAESGFRNIEFKGYKTGHELKQIVRNAWFVIVPSEWYENNPLTVIEAYSEGVPVIASRIGGLPEIVIEGETGYRFGKGDPASLRQAVEKAASLPDSRYASMASAAIAFARKNFDRTPYYDRLVTFYRSFLPPDRDQKG